jgi:hypothetical protein
MVSLISSTVFESESMPPTEQLESPQRFIYLDLAGGSSSIHPTNGRFLNECNKHGNINPESMWALSSSSTFVTDKRVFCAL